MNRLFPFSLLLIIGFAALVCAQETTAKKSEPAPIADNSFLIEEAYNQEKGVVQHINTFMRMRNGDWLYTFTQEWPVGSIKHQLSLTVPEQKLGDTTDGGRGFGDIAINYRYQLVGSGESKVAISPRVSLLLPTGSVRRGLGSGGLGIQTNLPVSIVVSHRFVTHWNAGATLTPAAKNARGQKAFAKGFNLGQSLIWLTSPRVNLLLETAWNSYESVSGPKQTAHSYAFYLNPGVRWAHNFKSGLQIVPGIAVPIGVGPSKGTHGLFFYLSFEHPFKRNRE